MGGAGQLGQLHLEHFNGFLGRNRAIRGAAVTAAPRPRSATPSS